MLLEECLFKNAYVLLNNAKNLPPELNIVVDLIVNTVKNNQYVIVIGAGKCSTVALKSTETMQSLNIFSIHLDSYLGIHGNLGMVQEGSLCIALSKSGKTAETIETFKGCQKKKAKLVSLTCSKNSPLGQIARSCEGYDIVLNCPDEMETDPCQVAPTTSVLLFTAIMDALSCCAAEKLGITKSIFVENHPGGSLGEGIRKELEDSAKEK